MILHCLTQSWGGRQYSELLLREYDDFILFCQLVQEPVEGIKWSAPRDDASIAGSRLFTLGDDDSAWAKDLWEQGVKHQADNLSDSSKA